MIAPADESDIRRLIASNAHLVDKRDPELIVAQFAEDATFIVAGNEIRGQAGLRAFFSQPSTNPGVNRHFVMSPVLVAESANRVTATAYFKLLRKTDADWIVAKVGRYEDVIERQADKSWRFQTRRIIFD